MQKVIFFIAVFGIYSAFGQKKIRTFLDQKQLYAPTIGNYLELQFEFDATSIQFMGKDSGLTAELAVNLIIKEGDKIIKTDGYRLNSPFMRDSIIENFYDIRRYALVPGRYMIDLQIFDINSKDEGVKASFNVVMDDFSKKTSISTIQAIEFASKSTDINHPLFKSGLIIIPKLSTYYPQDLEAMPIYAEVYGTDKFNRPFFGVKQKIIDLDTDQELTEFTEIIKLDTGKVVPLIRKINITNLYTGNYRLDLSVIDDKMNEVYTTGTVFERSNEPDFEMLTENVVLDPNFESSITKDSVLFYLGCLLPIANSETQRILMDNLADRNIEKARKTIQSFWVATAGANNAYEEWIKYKQQTLLVQRKFKTNFQDGYETDRGRVYLQYGSPTNIIQKETSPSEYPYEIWQYNKIGRFSNKRFIFYNRDLIGNNYTLLHSDMIGEIRNNNWPMALNQRNTSPGNIDDPNQNVQRHYGGASNDLFRQY